MPLDAQPDWRAALAEAEAHVTGSDPYRAGWAACMEWSDLDPPVHLSPDDAALWREGWHDAFDAPLGSSPTAADLMRAGVF